MEDSFRFKQFEVKQAGAAMRVNTDGVLLGAWANLAAFPIHTPGALGILDIGTGTGVIAMMLAQRSAQEKNELFSVLPIDALEPDPDSAAAARENFTASPWTARMNLFPNTVQAYQQTVAREYYGLIVSNPPYFENALRPPDPGRCLVRHTDQLSYTELMSAAAYLLHPVGRLALVLPADSKEKIVNIAAERTLFLSRETLVFTRPGKAPKRVLLEFCKKNEPLQSDSLVIQDQYGYSTDYKNLTKDFYLAF